METATLDRLFLELSQFTQATTAKELALQARIAELEAALRDLRQHWCNHYCTIGLHTGICDDARKALEE